MFTGFRKKYNYALILLKQLVVTDFKLRYQNSILGYIWSILKPLFLFVILYVVFVYMLGVGSDVPHFSVYLLLGVVLWGFFTEVTSMSIGAIVGRGDLMRKINFPHYIVVLASAVSALINLLINLVVVFIFIFMNGVKLTATAWLAPLLIIELFLLSIAVGLILSCVYVKFRDIGFIWEVVLQGLFFATPIMYSFSLVVQKNINVGKLLILNPLAQIVQDARYVLITQETLTIEDIYGSGWPRLIVVSSVFILFIVGAFYFKKNSPNFAENV